MTSYLQTMTTRGLALGGGGPVGIAWEIGLLAGLREGGVVLAEAAEHVVGTSAGAFVGSLVAAGLSVEEIVERQRAATASAPRDDAPAARPDPAKLAEIFRIWARAESLDQKTRRQIARLAAEAAGDRANPLVAFVARLTEGLAWPAGFAATTVEVESGEFVLFDAESDAPLAPAVAASCAVPGIFPPVEVGGSRYVDGGVRSGTSADALLAAEPTHALVIAPLSDDSRGGIGRQMDRCMREEVGALERAGVETAVIAPDEADRTAFGPNMMDGSRRDEITAAGHARGLREAASSSLAAWR